MTPSPIQIHAHGPFGEAVLRACHDLARIAPVLVASTLASNSDLQQASGALVVTVSARPLRSYWASLDMISREIGFRWMAVELTDGVLQTGPVHNAPGVPCWRCTDRRQRSHQNEQDRLIELDLETHYDRNPHASLLGFTPATLALSRRAIAFASTSDGDLDRITRYSLHSLNIRAGRAIGLHGCETCFPHSLGRERFAAGLNGIAL